MMNRRTGRIRLHFVALQLVGLTIAVCFPQVTLWLPGQVLGN